MYKQFTTTAFLMLLVVTGQAQPAGDVFTSEKGRFRVSYQSQLDPIAINRMHSWTLMVADSGGEPVTGANIAIKGGMPQHNHGLATQPTILAKKLSAGAALHTAVRHVHHIGQVRQTFAVFLKRNAPLKARRDFTCCERAKCWC